ncbi:MAG: TetR/AcrR family transcriptional regulator [Emcibacter sp.]|nr:TetR/AcrR family transcriptional regulator [Emcibacter sp.]
MEIYSMKKSGKKSAKSEDRIHRIMQVTHEQILAVGLRNITLRSIARQCAIHLKTLQHYFPTKNDLLKAIYQDIIDDYLPPLTEILHLPEDPMPRFNRVLDELFRFVDDLNNQRFFIEIFSMAQNDDEWMQLLDQKFFAFYNRIGDLLAELNPDLNRKEGRKRALAMGAMMEGMMLFLGDNKPVRPERENLAEEIRGLLVLMATAPKIADNLEK